jgi:hypothetical protein
VNSVCRSRFSERLNLSFRCHIERAGRLTSQSNLRQGRGRGCFEAPLARSGPPSIARHAAASPSGRSLRRRYDLGISVRERRPALGVELSPSTHGIKHVLRQPVRSAEFQGGPRQRPPPAWRPIGLHGPDSFRERHSAPGVLETARARALAPPPALASGALRPQCGTISGVSTPEQHRHLHRPSGSDGAPPGPPAPGAPGLAFPAAFTIRPSCIRRWLLDNPRPGAPLLFLRHAPTPQVTTAT